MAIIIGIGWYARCSATPKYQDVCVYMCIYIYIYIYIYTYTYIYIYIHIYIYIYTHTYVVLLVLSLSLSWLYIYIYAYKKGRHPLDKQASSCIRSAPGLNNSNSRNIPLVLRNTHEICHLNQEICPPLRNVQGLLHQQVVIVLRNGCQIQTRCRLQIT